MRSHRSGEPPPQLLEPYCILQDADQMPLLHETFMMPTVKNLSPSLCISVALPYKVVYLYA